MFCPICKNVITSITHKCSVCGRVFKTKKSSKKSKSKKKNNVKVNSSKKKSKSKSKKNQKRKSKKKKDAENKKKRHEIRQNMLLGGKTRHYNDRRKMEFAVLGYY